MQNKLPVELLSAADMQAVDARAIADGADGFMLMRRAGEAVARHALRLTEPGDSIVVAAGIGNNGGDGAIAACALQAGGRDVTLLRVGSCARVGSDAEQAFSAWNGQTCIIDPVAKHLGDSAAQLLGNADLIVDALLGAGLSRDVDGVLALLIDNINRSSAQVLAVDLPSGLDGDVHHARGIAVRADVTVTFVRYKIAHCLRAGRALCGELHLVDIGMPARAVNVVLAGNNTRCMLNLPRLWRDKLVLPHIDTHKYRRGQVLVRGGPPHQTGAARLAATAALHAGAGVVALATTSDALTMNAAQLTAVMLRRCDTSSDWQTLVDEERVDAVVVGPGNGVDETTVHAVDVALASRGAVVLDADALTCRSSEPLAHINRLASASGDLVLTPHDGEFSRLFGHTDILDLPSRLHRARAAAALTRCTVVLKGPDTVVADKDGLASIAVNAPPWLATAGAGDVLAGTIAALLAQGMRGFDAASAGVWLHGDAARGLGWPMTAEQLATAVGEALGRVAALDPPSLPGSLECIDKSV